MSTLSEQNFYEILEIPADASPQEIDRAYRITRATYEAGSMATYSVFSDEDNAEILRRVEEAYAVLSDERLRREYDARLRREGVRPPSRAAREDEAPPAPPQRSAPPPPSAPPGVPPSGSSLDLEPELEPDDGVYDGPVLRRIRMSHGIDLADIAAHTKINETYLDFIEANRFGDLPAPVYVRGFVKEYAKCLRLDPKLVADSYLACMQQRRRP